MILVKPETVIRWRERKFREFWRRKSQNRPGRPAIPNEHIDFIRRISSDHPEYGEDRIALELEVKFGICHACSTVRRYMVKRRPGPTDSQAWRSFLKNQAQAMWSCDFFVQHTVGFQVLYVFVVMEMANRKVITPACNRLSNPRVDETTNSGTPASRSNPSSCFTTMTGNLGNSAGPSELKMTGKTVSCRSAFDVWLLQEMGIRGISIPYGAA